MLRRSSIADLNQRVRLYVRMDRHGGAAAVGSLVALAAVLFLLTLPDRFGPDAGNPALAALGGHELRGDRLRSPTIERLALTFENHGYRLETAARAGDVPRLFLERLPPALDSISEIDRRKEMFLLGILPLILHVNDVIRAQRARFLRLAEKLQAGGALRRPDLVWLEALARRYGTTAADLDTLRRRVDVVPPALALAQAAVESSWGRSRFAREGNALFGQWTYEHGRGMKPRDADAGTRHGVTRFDRLVDSVAAYAMNLNTHRAYAGFRREREAMRRAGEPLDADVLAGTLHRYSEQRDEYVIKLRRVINGNRLSRLAQARLRPPA